MKTIAVITSTRADFGLLMPVIRALRTFGNEKVSTEVVVTGTHLSSEYGFTIEEIEKSHIPIDEKIQIPLKSSSPVDISTNQAFTLRAFAELFARKKYSGIVILGDRYEILMIAIAAGNAGIPIFHLSGGDTTEGAMDEWIRHSITKMSYLHFPTNYESYRRVLQLGENPGRVFNYGSTSIDNIRSMKLQESAEVLRSIGLRDEPYAVCTYHPVTMESNTVEKDMQDFLAAIQSYPRIQFIITKANADKGGAKMNTLLEQGEKRIRNIHVVASLGVLRYLSLVKGAQFVLGNSSSGIVEAPALKVPTVNIGDRQRGRLQSESIINCKANKESICKAIDKAISREFQNSCKSVKSPYGDGHAAEKIGKKIVEVILKDKINLKKSFYNIEVSKG